MISGSIVSAPRRHKLECAAGVVRQLASADEGLGGKHTSLPHWPCGGGSAEGRLSSSVSRAPDPSGPARIACAALLPYHPPSAPDLVSSAPLKRRSPARNTRVLVGHCVAGALRRVGGGGAVGLGWRLRLPFQRSRVGPAVPPRPRPSPTSLRLCIASPSPCPP